MIFRYNAGQALRQANEHLERKVRERTKALVQSNTLLQDQKTELDSSLEKLKSTQADLERLAMTDELTGLFARRFVFEWIRKELAGILRKQGQLSCLMLDIDHFKKINDSYGHIQGDVVLRRVAENIRTTVRSADIAGRFGGEEFIVLLPETAQAGAVQVAEKIRKAVDNPDAEIPATISVGVAVCDSIHLPGNTETNVLLDALLQAADEALYQAKKQGRNRVVAAPDNSV
ncbi:MAG: diguanylate cyclase [Anaerolineae bacterium]|nr:diguanylate cyclase [Anaerolineae bacterium]